MNALMLALLAGGIPTLGMAIFGILWLSAERRAHRYETERDRRPGPATVRGRPDPAGGDAVAVPAGPRGLRRMVEVLMPEFVWVVAMDDGDVGWDTEAFGPYAHPTAAREDEQAVYDWVHSRGYQEEFEDYRVDLVRILPPSELGERPGPGRFAQPAPGRDEDGRP